MECTDMKGLPIKVGDTVALNLGNLSVEGRVVDCFDENEVKLDIKGVVLVTNAINTVWLP